MLTDENVLTFTEAARRLPKLNGKHPHSSTLWRWARRGLQGVKLETRRLGSRFITSVEALDRFSKALAEIDLPDRPTRPVKKSTNKQRQKSIERANRTLEKAGII